MGFLQLLCDMLDAPLHLDELSTTFVTQSSVDIKGAVDSPAMAANLAFHQAWAAALGVRPTRIDFYEFVQRLAQPQAQSQVQAQAQAQAQPQAQGPFLQTAAVGATWGAATATALQFTVLECTPLRMSPQQVAQQLLTKAADAYQRTLASLQAGGTVTRVGLLSAKIRDRFAFHDALPMPTTTDDFVREYASLVCHVAGPKLLQQTQTLSSSTTVPNSTSTSNSVASFYAKMEELLDFWELPQRDVFGGWYCNSNDGGGIWRLPLPPITVVEALRLGVMRDAYLWRQDAGGVLVLLDSAGALVHDPLASLLSKRNNFKIRTVCGRAPLLLSALPTVLYARVFVVCPTSEAAELVRQHPVCRAEGTRIVVIVQARTDQSQTMWFSPRWIGGPTEPSGPGVACTSMWLPSDAGAFGAVVVPPAWAPLLCAKMATDCFNHVLSLPSDATKPAGAAGVLIFQQFVARYAAQRSLAERVFVTCPSSTAPPCGEVVLIDNRRNVWSLLSLLITLDNLRCADWSVVVFVGSANLEFMRTNVMLHVPHARVEVLQELDGDAAFDIEAYNVLLKSTALWRRIRASRALLIQDDGLIARPGLEDEADMIGQSFIGAPWDPALGCSPNYRQTLVAAGVSPSLVGNGGMSLRNVASMIQCTEQPPCLKDALFNTNAQPVPEDVYFSAALARLGHPECPRELAARFAFEELPPDPFPLPYGFHKPWAYVPLQRLVAYFEAILSLPGLTQHKSS